MRIRFMFLALCIAVVCAIPAEACEDCGSYFDYQSLDWCLYCEESNCGYFTCEIREDWFGDSYCTGDDAGCFTPGYNCPREPRYDVSLPQNLDETWRLSRVRVYKTTAGVSGQTPGAAAISGARG